MSFEEWKEKYFKINQHMVSGMLDDGIDPGEVEWFIEDMAKKEYKQFLESQK